MVAGAAARLVPLAVAAVLAGACSTTANGRVTAPTTIPSTTITGSSPPGSTTTTAVPSAKPRVLVAVTTGGAVQILDPDTGHALRTLATGATGDEMAVTPDGAAVFYETPTGCTHAIDKVATAGGSATVVAHGSYPTISASGTLLAYAVEPHYSPDPAACQAAAVGAGDFSVVVRNLVTDTETTFPLPPGVIANGLPLPIGHLSWAPDGRRLAVTIIGGQDNEQWNELIVDTTTDKYYTGGTSASVPVTGPKGSYYREAVFLPDGDLFTDRECCAGNPPHVTSSMMVTFDPANGTTHQQIAVGLTTRDHTSLDGDNSGHWLLYLSGADLLVSHDGAKPSTLATGLQAADW